jgi:tricorn protease-like protein
MAGLLQGVAQRVEHLQLYSLADAKSTQVTDGMSDATNPVFDKDGKYLYFTARRMPAKASASTSTL